MAKENYYRFLQQVTYSPLRDKEYLPGQTDYLKKWKPQHIKNALAAGQIERVVLKPNEKDGAGD